MQGCNINAKKPYAKYELLSGDTVDIKFKVYDSLDNLIEIFYEKDSLRHGLNEEFYLNGIKKTEGQWYKGKKTRWFKYYDENGKLKVLRQYISIDDTTNWNSDEAYLNQVIRFNDNGDTVKDGSFFMRLLTVGDTIKNGNEYSFKVVLVAPLFKNAYLILCDFDSEYKLLPNAVCDTFSMKDYQRVLSPKDYHLGENIIRGKIVNFENYIDTLGESRQHIATIYFRDKFYVK